ncbi:glycosyltransferase [Alphaproteobacteria bacterium HT1-32]|nr:glycosyltransferase [Alphaproteobacteria bacterium HT1-32]|tara:strand:+ start:5324 stop:6271 length:948 start_codon:yes stop_codon:yes gene_type:complete
MSETIDLSIVVPVYNGAASVPKLVEALTALPFDGQMEIVLVDDGSPDNSGDVCEKLAAASDRVPVRAVLHSRNFGEHNAVLTGLREARGDIVITMDDDLQNPPEEVLKLWQAMRDGDDDVIYGVFGQKQHAGWRNLGSWLANATADLVLDKPKGLYLSSFRCLRGEIAKAVSAYRGPYPYVDGLIFQITRRARGVRVEHLPRANGASNYTLRRLIRLWLIVLMNFSTLPLRLSALLGLAMSGVGFLGLIAVLGEYFLFGVPITGWTSIMSVVLLFFGMQMMILGLIGEYLGRVFLTVNERPQSNVRRITDRRDDL